MHHELTPSVLAPRGVYEQQYRLNGMVVLVAVDRHGDYIGHELVADEEQYQMARDRLEAMLASRDPLPPLRLASG